MRGQSSYLERMALIRCAPDTVKRSIGNISVCRDYDFRDLTAYKVIWHHLESPLPLMEYIKVTKQLQVRQLAKEKEATPKSLMRVMGIDGLTLYHLKSHLQKYRLGKGQHSEARIDNVQQECKDQTCHSIRDCIDGSKIQINESLRIAQALQMQMDVQKKLHEQIEVQRHLQLRIEAQGKYLQSVLKKAQDTLSEYNSSSVEVEIAKAELSQLVSMVGNGCATSSLTDVRNSTLEDVENKSSSFLQSSLTVSENCILKEVNQQKHESNNSNTNSGLKLLMNMQPEDNSRLTEQGSARKRSGSTISDGNNFKEISRKKSASQKNSDEMKKFDMSETFDLNIHLLKDLNTSPKTIDLNCNAVEHFYN